MTTTFNFRGPNDPHLGASFIPTGSALPVNGIFLPAANTVGIASNSLERIRILSNGNVGIGRTNPLEALHVQGGATASAKHLARFGLASSFDSLLVGHYGPGNFTDDEPAIHTTSTDHSTGQAGNIVYKARSGVNNRAHIFQTGSTPTERFRIANNGKILSASGTHWVGTVSENGTSSIVERGSNANGEYVKFADGTVMARRRVPAITTDNTTVDYNFPIAVVSNTSVSSFSLAASLTNESRRKSMRDYSVGGDLLWSLAVNQSDSYTLQDADVNLFMLGRWF